MVYARVSRTPALIFITAVWQFSGEILKLSLGPQTSDWAYHHGGGKVRIAWEDPAEVPDWWSARFLELYGVEFDNSAGHIIYPRGVIRLDKAGRGVISSAEADCWGSCILPVSDPDLVRGMFGQVRGDAILGGPEWDGPWSQRLDWVSESQVDPTTLSKPVDGEVSTYILDQEVLESVALNDLLETFGASS